MFNKTIERVSYKKYTVKVYERTSKDVGYRYNIEATCPFSYTITRGNIPHSAVEDKSVFEIAKNYKEEIDKKAEAVFRPFLKDLKTLLEKHKEATIGFSCGSASDTHGIYDDEMVVTLPVVINDRITIDATYTLACGWCFDIGDL